jgi:hypothetical protein
MNSANPIRIASQDFVCKCGFKGRVDFEAPRPGVRQVEPSFLKAHCSKDTDHPVPGKIVQVYEEREES